MPALKSEFSVETSGRSLLDGSIDADFVKDDS